MKLTFAEPWPAFAAILFALAVLVFVWFSARTLRRITDRRSRIVFLALRMAAVALLLSLLLDPVLSRDHLKTEDLSVVVLVDRSRSMSIPDSYGGRPRYKVAAEFLNAPETGLLPLLGDDFRVVPLAFDSGTRAARPADLDGTTAPRGEITDLAGAIRAAGRAVSRAEAVAVVVLTDGAENGGGDAREAAREIGTPLYTVGFGSQAGGAAGRRDLVLAAVDAPETSFAENTVVADATVRSTGYPLDDPGNRRVRVVLREGDAEIASAWVAFTAEGRPEHVSLRFVPSGTGRHTYRVSVPVRGDEAIPDNNVRTFGLSVLDRRASVLYFDATLRWEAKFLRDFLARDPAIDLTSVLHSGRGRLLVKGDAHGADLSRGLPATGRGFGRFDVVILGDVEAGAIDSARMELLRARVEAGGGLLTIGGYHTYGSGGYAGTPLAEAVPVFLRETHGQIDTPVTLSLTPEGRVHPMLSGLERWFSGANRPRLKGLTEVGREKPGAQVLLTAAVEGRGEAIVLAAQRYGEGRAVAFTGDTTWIWARSPAFGGEGGLYERFWGQVLRWLLEKEPGVEQAGEPVVLETDRPSYRLGETIGIAVRVRDRTGKPVADASISGTFEDPQGDRTLEFVPRPRVPGSYTAGVRAKRPGEARVRVRAVRRGKELGRAEIAIPIEKTSVEMDRVDLDDERLSAMARISGGRYVHAPPTGKELDQDIRGSLVGLVTHQEIPLSNAPLFLLLFVALVTAEWFLRRRRNLL